VFFIDSFYHGIMMIWHAALFGQVPSRAIGWDVDCKTANLEHIAAPKPRRKQKIKEQKLYKC
jgi:hypothetical protein